MGMGRFARWLRGNANASADPAILVLWGIGALGGRTLQALTELIGRAAAQGAGFDVGSIQIPVVAVVRGAVAVAFFVAAALVSRANRRARRPFSIRSAGAPPEEDRPRRVRAVVMAVIGAPVVFGLLCIPFLLFACVVAFAGSEFGLSGGTFVATASAMVIFALAALAAGHWGGSRGGQPGWLMGMLGMCAWVGLMFGITAVDKPQEIPALVSVPNALDVFVWLACGALGGILGARWEGEGEGNSAIRNPQSVTGEEERIRQDTQD
jgi:putative membrane protein (TIGR04086 family)